MTDTSVAVAHFAINDFRLGSIISRSGAVLWRHSLTFFTVTLVAYSPPVLIESLKATEPIQGSEGLAEAVYAQAVWSNLGSVLVIVLGTVGCGGLMHATFQDMRRRPVRLADSLNAAMRRFFPLVGLALLTGFLVALGLILLIIPGLLLNTIWFVNMPACVVERRGLWTSLRRSHELTKGYRWKLSALATLLLVGKLGCSLIAFELLAHEYPIMVELGGAWISSGLSAAFSAIVITIAYYDLRAIKERAGVGQITAVFD